MKNLSKNIINEELKYYYNENKMNIIHEFRICYPYNITINNKNIGSLQSYIDENKKYFYILSEENHDLYFLETYLKKYNIYGLKYYNIDFIGNSTFKIRI